MSCPSDRAIILFDSNLAFVILDGIFFLSAIFDDSQFKSSASVTMS